MNCIALTGTLKENFNEEYRELEYTSPFSYDDLLEIKRIKVRYWTNQFKNRLSLLKSETKVLIHGHLEEHEIFGTILLAEELEVIS